MIRINMKVIGSVSGFILALALSLFRDQLKEFPDSAMMILYIVLIVVTSIQVIRLFSDRHLDEPDIVLKSEKSYMISTIITCLITVGMVYLNYKQPSLIFSIVTLYFLSIAVRQFMTKFEPEGIFEDHIIVQRKKIFFDDITDSYSSENGYTVETSFKFLVFNLYTPTELKVDYDQVDDIEALVKKHVKANLAS